MNATRIAQITESLKNLATQPGVFYTNQEIIDRLIELQAALAKGVFEKTHAEYLRDQEVMLHFTTLAKKYAIDETETYRRFSENMKELSYTIATLIKGRNGERNVKKALKLLSFDEGVKILYNVCLEDEDSQTEYDAIAVTPYGLFVVEVKNWFGDVVIKPSGVITRGKNEQKTYDLIGRMNIKEALLREYLGNLFPKQYFNLLVFSDEKTEVDDQYHRIPFCVGSGATNEIRNFAKLGNELSKERIDKICECIMEHHKEQKTLCTVRCDEIIQDYATLMAQIEFCASNETICPKDVGDEISADGQEQEVSSGIRIVAYPKQKAKRHKSFGRSNWDVVGQVVSVLSIAVPAVFSVVNACRK